MLLHQHCGHTVIIPDIQYFVGGSLSVQIFGSSSVLDKEQQSKKDDSLLISDKNNVCLHPR